LEKNDKEIKKGTIPSKNPREKKFGKNISEEEYEQVYSSLKREIQSKNSIGAKICRICGKSEKNTLRDFKRCPICDILVCNKCTSCGFCLNCYVNLNEDARKTLKLTRILALTIPGLLLFLLIYGILYYILVSSFLMIFFGTLHYYTRYQIRENHGRFLDKKWLKRINLPQYQQLTNQRNKKTYFTVFDDNPRKVEKTVKKKKIKEKRIEKEMATNKRVKKERMKNLIQAQWTETPEKYRMIHEECPHCGEEIKFADFCTNCEIRYCPECGEHNNPYSRKCICGYQFSNLEMEFKKYLDSESKSKNDQE